jgi:hypothetical protein
VSGKLTGSVSTNPSFEMNVLNNEKFQRGIQQPVKTEVIEFIRQQGWRDDLLMALLIERIDVIAAAAGNGFEKGETITSLNNANLRGPGAYPGENESSAAWLAFLTAKKMVPKATTKAAVNLVRVDKLLAQSSIGDLSLLDGKAFEIGETEKISYIRRPESNGVTIAFADRKWPATPCRPRAETANAADADPMTAAANTAQVKANTIEIGGPKVMALLIETDEEHRSKADPHPTENGIETLPAKLTIGGKTIKVSLRVIPRSVQGMMYFLGEYSRGGKHRYCLPSGQLVFDLREGVEPGAAVATRFRDKRYSIPDAAIDNGISLQVIDLIQQLLNLHKSADELPFTRSVTVVQ